MNREVLDARTARTWTPSQLSAISSRARTLVTAAAGSGKTSVLTELVTQALVAGEIAPAQVCAVTFTEKAAQEMRGRVAQRLADLGERDLLAELELARIGTIHSLCASILRRHGAAVGVDPRVGQLDEAQHAWILRAASHDAISGGATDPDCHWLRARIGDERIDALLRGIYQCASQGDGTANLVVPEDVEAIVDAKTHETVVSASDGRRTVAATTRLWEAFSAGVEARKRAVGRISFDDLERCAVEAVRVPAVRTELRARWGMLLVDEFQDTNARQYELLDAIGDDRLFMVGDEWQSIYRFRGADVDVFRARRDDDAAAVVVPMRENFRSVAPVLDVVNRVFAHDRLFGDRYEDVRPGTEAQRAVSGPAVELLVVPDCVVDGAPAANARRGREREALRVAERIADLVRSGEAQPGEIAVLYARGTGVDIYEQALAAWGIPVLRGASSGFYDQRDVRDALAVLALVRNRADGFAATSVLAGPLARLEWSELDDLAVAAKAAGTALYDAALDSGIPGARRAMQLVADLAEVARGGSLVDLVALVTSLREFEVGAATSADGARRVANLRRLVELAASARQVGIRDVGGFLEFVAAQRRDARVGEASVADEAVGAVRMLTVHASKGLEFPHVFVIEAAAGGAARPDSMPVPTRDAAGIVHVPVARRDGRCEPTAALAELHEMDALAEREERLRLWYVAMTRAERRLHVSGRWDFTPRRDGKPRSVPGALSWLQASLELDEWFGGVDRTVMALDGLVLLDTRPAREEPRAVWSRDGVRMQLAEPCEVPAEEPVPKPDRADRAALRQALGDAVSGARHDEWRQLEGTRMHDAVARLLDAARAGVAIAHLLDPEQGPWLTDAVRDRLATVVASDVFRRLVDAAARSEVPYLAGAGPTVASRVLPGLDVASSTSVVDAGRMDALAVLEDGRWWVVDWKATLPDTDAERWQVHGDQLQRYARAALAAGARGAIVTLVPLDRPDRTSSWALGDAQSPATPTPMP